MSDKPSTPDRADSASEGLQRAVRAVRTEASARAAFGDVVAAEALTIALTVLNLHTKLVVALTAAYAELETLGCELEELNSGTRRFVSTLPNPEICRLVQGAVRAAREIAK